jgi:hypothetical protein
MALQFIVYYVLFSIAINSVALGVKVAVIETK